MDPPLEVVHIPFEGKEITGYLRLPKNTKGPVPLVIAVNGLDSRKEDLTESFGAILPFGIGFLAVDGPGTGQAPIKVSETSERMLSKVIDYAQSRPEIDKNRIALHGVSWGAYWATKMAIVERARLRGCSAQSPPVDRFFQKDFLMNSSAGESRISIRSGPRAHEYSRRRSLPRRDGRVLPKMSLVHQGLLGKPMAPMLIIAGVLDTQVPIDDEYLLLSKGDVPKEAWINPRRRTSRQTSGSVARSPDLQGSDHPVAGENAARRPEIKNQMKDGSRCGESDLCCRCTVVV